MKSKPTIILFVVVLTLILLPSPAPGNSTETDEMKVKLEALLDEYIVCCEVKSAFRNSRSEKIRHSAKRSCMKAEFCRHNRKELVKVMLENNIEPKAYKVRHFLNNRFNEVLQASK